MDTEFSRAILDGSFCPVCRVVKTRGALCCGRCWLRIPADVQRRVMMLVMGDGLEEAVHEALMGLMGRALSREVRDAVTE